MLKCVWHCTLTAVREGLGVVGRVRGLIPGNNRADSWLIGKGAQGLAWLTGGSCNMQRGMRVCQAGWMTPRTGTTYGDTLVVKDKSDLDTKFLDHEKAHRDKHWRKYGQWFALMYGVEALRTWGDPCSNNYENQASLSKGYPSSC